MNAKFMAALAVVFAVVAGTAAAVPAAKKLLTGKDIKDGSIGIVDLSSSTRVGLKGARGAHGPRAPTARRAIPGPAGREGRHGSGRAGPRAAGPAGRQGPQGAERCGLGAAGQTPGAVEATGMGACRPATPRPGTPSRARAMRRRRRRGDQGRRRLRSRSRGARRPRLPRRPAASRRDGTVRMAARRSDRSQAGGYWGTSESSGADRARS